MRRDTLSPMNRVGRLGTLACGLMLLGGGCGGGPKDGETVPQIAQAQSSESSAWAKAKAEGKDKRKSVQAVKNPGRRGYVNRPGG